MTENLAEPVRVRNVNTDIVIPEAVNQYQKDLKWHAITVASMVVILAVAVLAMIVL